MSQARVIGTAARGAVGLLAALLAMGLSAQAPRACPEPAELAAVHLYGQWRAEFDDGETVTLRLERHPEHTGSLRGTLTRSARSALLAGDIDDGELVLDESDDGQRISAVWVAQAVAGQCGRVFNGQRRVAQGAAGAAGAADATSPSSPPVLRRFVLRRAPGWN